MFEKVGSKRYSGVGTVGSEVESNSAERVFANTCGEKLITTEKFTSFFTSVKVIFAIGDLYVNIIISKVNIFLDEFLTKTVFICSPSELERRGRGKEVFKNSRFKLFSIIWQLFNFLIYRVGQK